MSRERGESDQDTESVTPADAFWELEPGASGERSVSENVDEALYDS